MGFEYDSNKSDKNKEKHGIDFEQAKHLWNDVDRLEVQANSEDEVRFALIAKYQEKLWTAFYTLREKRIRIISVRRSRKGEKRLYYES